MLKIMPLPHRSWFLPLAFIPWLLAGQAQADSFPSWYAKAQKEDARHDDDAALQAWSNALHLWKSTDSKPKKARALAARAAVYGRKGEWDAALEDLSGALKLENKDAVLFHQRGVLYLEHGKASEAISDFYKATALKPDYPEAFFDRGRAYDSQGDAEFSKEDFRAACRLGLQKACSKAATSKGAAKSRGKDRAPVHAAPAPSPAPAVQTSSVPPSQTPKASSSRPSPAANVSTTTPPAESQTASADKKLPIGKTLYDKQAPQAAPPPNFNSCINRITACSENGDSYSTCVSRARLCEKTPKQGCCPRDCVILFKKLLHSKSEAAAFRKVFAPKSACLYFKQPMSYKTPENAAP